MICCCFIAKPHRCERGGNENENDSAGVYEIEAEREGGDNHANCGLKLVSESYRLCSV